MKLGFVLEGGAMRGMYTEGVLDTLKEKNIIADGIIGVSAGVLFGVNYKSNQPKRALRYCKKYAADKRFMGIKSLITTGDYINVKFGYDTIPNHLEKFDYEAFDNNKMKFYATITNVDTGKAEYPLLTNSKKQMHIMRASGSMPFLSRIVKLPTGKYLDGAIADSIPVKKMMEMGYDRIIIVLTRPAGYKKKKAPSMMTKIYYTNYPNLVKAINTRYIKYNETIDYIEELERKGKIIIIRPSEDLGVKRTEKDPEKLQAIYDLGIKDTEDKLKEIEKYIKE
jgi:predicted patatin/cPLA2 family phospholipase